MLDRMAEVNFNNISDDHWIIAALKRLEFSVINWEGWSPSLREKSSWQLWANEELDLSALKVPEDGSLLNGPSTSFLPIVMRKKLSPVSKVFLHLSNAILCEVENSQIPIVFSSRFGEARATVELLEAVGRSETGSPMAFSRSVHNFSVGLNSIATKNKVTNTAVAAMENSFLCRAIGSFNAASYYRF